MIREDRAISEHIQTVADMISDGSLLEAVEKSVDSLR
jgi:hypothetical protein